MAEVQDSGGGGKKKGKKIRSKKHSTHIDMTPMVDLAFLLLTFFLFTTTLSKPQTMEIIMPDKPKDEVDETKVKASNALTLILSKDNKIFYYFGVPEAGNLQMEKTSFSPKGIRKILIDKKGEVAARRNSKGEPEKLTVLIKATEAAKYKNVVDILDEMNINQIPSYAIVDIMPEEAGFVKGLEQQAPTN